MSNLNKQAPDNHPTRHFRSLDIEKIRADFPILAQKVNGHELIYFDNAATSQKPLSVIKAVDTYYQSSNSNVHRGAHYLSDQATQQFEQARQKVQAYINAANREEVIWTRGTTEAINLVAQTWGRQNIKADDEIILSSLEHHSNIVPWQMLAEEKKAHIRVINIDADGQLDLSHFESLLCDKTKLVSVGHVSNALGVTNPIQDIIKLAHQQGAKVLIDGAQAMAHSSVDVQQLDCDFYAFSGHKMFAPMGIGVLYGKSELLNSMPPWQGGGEMIEKVSFDKTTFNQIPYKFEAGTPNVSGAIGIATAIDYLAQFNSDDIAAYEQQLLNYATQALLKIEGLVIEGNCPNKVAVISFNIVGCHGQDLGMLLDQQGVALRTGHHCAMPLMQCLGINGTVRVSFSFYNNQQEIDQFVQALIKAKSMLV
ncbi:MAG: cysteine desulfurase [Enterobacterales bacterium]|nr:cysteine desulfurase [Enterobacterales bacterium]